jgi:arylsulfatase A-like enzyme/tetratricopeptide (TPR) repeat protein
MTHKTAPALAGLAMAALACGGGRSSPRFAGAPVVLISIDTLRSDHLPAYGYRALETPHLDRFRRDAILFRHAYSPCPMTLPSHVTMLTGLQPPEHGVRNNIGFAFRSADHASLPTILKKQGYATGAAVSSYVLRGETGLAAAFDSYEDSIDPRPGGAFADFQRPGHTTEALAREWVQARKDAPFFFFLHLYEPHVPYDPPEPFRSRYTLAYDGEIATADGIVGDFLDFLRSAGVYDRALIVVTSDHGEGLGDHGEDQHSILLYREALQVPLLLKLPGSPRAGESVDAPAQLADLAPTVTEVLGLETPAAAKGASLLRLPSSRSLYAETLYPRIQLGWSDLHSLMDERYHYIEGPRPELYDLVQDPGEARDLAAAQAAVAARMRNELARVPSGATRPGDVDPAAVERLATLGYVGTPRPRGSGPLPNPRDNVPLLGRFRDGLRLADQKRFAEAVAALRAIVAESPGMVEVWTKLGDVNRQMGNPDDAARDYAEAIRRCPAPSADMVLSLAQAELARGRFDPADAAARQALEASPARAHELLARVALARGLLDEAEARARAARESHPQPSTDLLLAEIAIRRGDHAGALRLLDATARHAAELKMDHVYGLDFLRGDALARLARPAEAEAAYRREIEAFPDHLQAYTNLAVVYFVQRKRAAVQSILEDMARVNPGPSAYRLAAKTWEAFGDRKTAAAWRQRK